MLSLLRKQKALASTGSPMAEFLQLVTRVFALLHGLSQSPVPWKELISYKLSTSTISLSSSLLIAPVMNRTEAMDVKVVILWLPTPTTKKTRQ